MAAPAASPLSLLRHPTFRVLWVAMLASNLGGLIQGVGAGWMMTSLTPSKDMVALVQSSSTLPFMAFALVAGALADSFERRRVMLAAQLFMAAVSALLAAVAFAGWMSPWLLLTFTFLIGCGTAVFNPSWQASIADIVGRAELSTAVTLNSMGFNLMRSIGPALGGAIVVAFGAAAAFAVNALSYLGLIWGLLRWQPPARDTRLPREHIGPAIAAGLRYVTLSPNLLSVMARGFLFGGAAISVMALLPLVAKNLLGGTALTYGFLLGAFGVGAIGGAFSNARLRARFTSETIARLGFAGFALGAVVLGLSRTEALSALALLLTGGCWVLTLSLFNVTVQLSTPRWVVGRAIAVYQTATFGGMAAGGWQWGAFAEVHGSDVALLLAGGALVVGGLVGLVMPLPQYGQIDLDPLDRFSEPALRLDLTNRSGPIMIMVDYEIDQADVVPFLAAMADRRRVRIRNGAQQWSLMRDLENPRIWTESYHVPTWVEYVRHHQRHTKAEGEITDRLRALHRGDGPPHVHRMIERQTVVAHDDMPIRELPEIAH